MVSTVLLSGVKRYEKTSCFGPSENWIKNDHKYFITIEDLGLTDSANSEAIAFFDDGLFIFPCGPLGSIHSLEV